MTPPAATYKMGPKGQVVIPKPIRDRLHLEPGDRVLVHEADDEVRIRKAVAGPVERRAVLAGLRGALAGGPSLTAGLEDERRAEREREDGAISGSGR
ncbi:MAG TPA: AbrB/MazE/SpoVT family DNA-binding domain-containing protein [Solirubrobacteraceae bacterium]|nr:AbrB/MazE/SpoVT family DNA-binding domain-containing protein [Solirubrobacteraceae bacterium]